MPRVRMVQAGVLAAIGFLQYAIAIALILGLPAARGGRTTAWDGFVSTSWGRAAAAVFLLSLGTLLFLAALKVGRRWPRKK